jgi:hypothetical protein
VAKKDLIIGAFKNYNFEQLKPWIHSINECGFEGDKVLIAIDASPETITKITQAGFTAVPAYSITGGMFHMERFIHIYDYLKNRIDDYRFVITTDVRDVVFQSDPMKYLEYHINDQNQLNLIAVSECIKIKDEHWNRDNIIKSFGPYFYDGVKDYEVLNVGTLAGRSHHVCDLCAALYQLSLNRADWVADQAAYNILMDWVPYREHTMISGLDDGFCCNLHVTHKPDEREKFAPFITETPPIFDGFRVYAAKTGEPYAIVHQYDRNPEMKKFFEDKYGVEELITFRTT